MELLKDGGGGDRRHNRDGLNGPGGQRGESEGDDSAEWSGVSTSAQVEFIIIFLKIQEFQSQPLWFHRRATGPSAAAAPSGRSATL